MPTKVEGQVLLQPADRVERVLVSRLLELFQRTVDTFDVRRMVLGVMKLHDLSGDMRSQGTVVVREIGKVVGGHRNPLGNVGEDHRRRTPCILRSSACGCRGIPLTRSRLLSRPSELPVPGSPEPTRSARTDSPAQSATVAKCRQ